MKQLTLSIKMTYDLAVIHAADLEDTESEEGDIKDAGYILAL